MPDYRVETTVRPGDKIDIELLFQKEQQDAGKEVEVVTYKSSVSDVLPNGTVEITMPTQNGKMLLFQVGLRCETTFLSGGGRYKAICVVKERYVKEGLYLLSIEPVTELVKIQRREFFRIECLLDMQFYTLDGDFDETSSPDEVYAHIQADEKSYRSKQGMINDISGGGIKFTSNERLKDDSYVFCIIKLNSGNVNELLYVLCHIVASKEIENVKGKYSNRAKFIFENVSDREKIVRFVFEEERRIRRKQIG